MNLIFVGGIIITANRPISKVPELTAIASRIGVVHHQVSTQETIAKLRSIASAGYRFGDDYVEPDECHEIVAYVIAECRRTQCPLDLRIACNGFGDYLQWRDCAAGCDWRDLITSRLSERAVVQRDIEPAGVRERKKQKELQIAREIADWPRERRVTEWHDRTGKSEAALYRRLNELARTDAEYS